MNNNRTSAGVNGAAGAAGSSTGGSVGGTGKEALLKKASDMLGMSASELRSSLATGDLSAIKNRMNPADREKLDKLMSDKAAIEKARKLVGK